jgi:hypothetical protein
MKKLIGSALIVLSVCWLGTYDWASVPVPLLAQDAAESKEISQETINSMAAMLAEEMAAIKAASESEIDIRFSPGVTLQAYVTLKADESGALQLDRSRPITVGGVGTDPVVTPNPTTQRAAKVRTAAMATQDQDTAKRLLAMYQGVSQQIRAGSFRNEAHLENSLKTLTDLFLNDPATAAKWKATRDVINELWVRVAQEGGEMGDYATLLDDVVSGLSAVAGDTDAINPEVITLIIRLVIGGKFDIQLILTLIQALLNR